jgi:hypothetical protein
VAGTLSPGPSAQLLVISMSVRACLGPYEKIRAVDVGCVVLSLRGTMAWGYPSVARRCRWQSIGIKGCG